MIVIRFFPDGRRIALAGGKISQNNPKARNWIEDVRARTAPQGRIQSCEVPIWKRILPTQITHDLECFVGSDANDTQGHLAVWSANRRSGGTGRFALNATAVLRFARFTSG
jgi:hypothetical protein